MSSIREEKQRLRDQVLALRAEMDEQKWAKKSDQIISTLIDTDFYKEAETIHSYISMNNRREVCTDKLFEQMFGSGKKVVVPITNFSDGTLSHSEITSASDLQANKWGVREPSTTKLVGADSLDVVIIPMVAADKKGNRLGYGKGFYDRFLNNTDAKKIGLVFEDYLYEKIPVEEFDIKLDVLISEKGVIYP